MMLMSANKIAIRPTTIYTAALMDNLLSVIFRKMIPGCPLKQDTPGSVFLLLFSNIINGKKIF